MEGNEIETAVVTTTYELRVAVAKMSDDAGGIIRVVNSGELYALNGYRLGNPDHDIRIIADDPDDPAVFKQVEFNQARNISFEGLRFESTMAEDQAKVDLQIGGSNIKFIGNTFVSNSDGFWDGSDDSAIVGTNLAKVRGTKGFVFENNDVSNYATGISLIDTTDTRISGNSFTQITGDPLRMSGVKETLIEGNTFAAIYGTTQDINHSDMIQVWSARYNNQNTENLTIRDNLFNTSDGAGTQTIFIRHEMYDWGLTDEKYKNITVENNTIYNGSSHGISISNTEGVLIKNNTLIHDIDAGIQSTPTSNAVSRAPGISLTRSEDGVVEGNIASRIFAPNSQVIDNVIINSNDPNSPNYVGHHFVNVQNVGEVDIRDISLLPDSPYNGVYGSTATNLYANGAGNGVKAVMTQANPVGEPNIFIYDAGLSFTGNGQLTAKDATFIWTFSDGTVLKGVRVERFYDVPGEYDVSLSVTANGLTDSITRRSTLEDPRLLEINFNNGDVADISNFQSKVYLENETDPVDGVTGGGFHLDGNSKVKIFRSAEQLRNLESFTIQISVKRDEGGSSGLLMHLFDGMNIKVEGNGSLSFTLLTTGEGGSVVSAPSLLSDDQWHRIAVTYSMNAPEDSIKLYLDGQLVGTGDASGVLSNTGRHDLVLGNTHGWGMQAAIDDFSIVKRVLVASEIEESFQKMKASLASPLEVDPLVLIDFSDGVQDVSGHGVDVVEVKYNDAESGLDVNSETYNLADATIRITRANWQLIDLDQFSFGISFKNDDIGSSGHFLTRHGSLNAKVGGDGTIQLTVRTENGLVALETRSGLLDNSDWHRIVISYNGTGEGENQGISIYVDGNLEAHADASGSMEDMNNQHLVIGRSFSFGESVNSEIDDFVMSSKAVDAGDVAKDFDLKSAEPRFTAEPVVDVPPPLGLVESLVEPVDMESILLSINFDDGVVDASAYASDLYLQGNDAITSGFSGEGFHLDGGGTQLRIDRSNDQLRNLDAFSVGTSIKLDKDGQKGVFFHLHGGLNAKIESDGSVKFLLVTTDGAFAVESPAGVVDDNDWHRLQFTFDGSEESGSDLRLYVDGELAGENTEVTGDFAPPPWHHYVIGNTFGGTMEGTVDDFVISRDVLSEAQVIQDYAELYDIA